MKKLVMALAIALGGVGVALAEYPSVKKAAYFNWDVVFLTLPESDEVAKILMEAQKKGEEEIQPNFDRREEIQKQSIPLAVEMNKYSGPTKEERERYAKLQENMNKLQEQYDRLTSTVKMQQDRLEQEVMQKKDEQYRKGAIKIRDAADVIRSKKGLDAVIRLPVEIVSINPSLDVTQEIIDEIKKKE